MLPDNLAGVPIGITDSPSLLLILERLLRLERKRFAASSVLPM